MIDERLNINPLPASMVITNFVQGIEDSNYVADSF